MTTTNRRRLSDALFVYILPTITVLMLAWLVGRVEGLDALTERVEQNTRTCNENRQAINAAISNIYPKDLLCRELQVVGGRLKNVEDNLMGSRNNSPKHND